MRKLKVGIMGATGAAGLEFVKTLYDHPWFEIEAFYASEKSTGKPFAEACPLDTSGFPEEIRQKPVISIDNAGDGHDLICSALPSDVARRVEERCARHTPVISTTSAFRYEQDVPILITEINPEHHYLLNLQRTRGWKGWIAPGPNCTTVGLVMSLYPIYKEFGIRRVNMSSYQSVSGGGKTLIDRWKEQRTLKLPEPLPDPGEPVKNPDVVLEGNVIGHIKDEEKKVRRETLKILGTYRPFRVTPADFDINCRCVRVPVAVGHFETVFVKPEKSCSETSLRDAYAKYNERWKKEFGELPSSPKNAPPIVILDRAPQPFFDVNLGDGMTTTIGRLEVRHYPNGEIVYEVLSNNLEKGAAKGIIHAAEYLHRVGFLRGKQ